MGHTDPVQMANDELKKNLGYHLDLANAEQFRTAIRFCGLQRFRLCLMLVHLQGDYGARGIKHTPETKHKTLLALMRLCAPHKGPDVKLRNPQAAASVAMTDQLDRDMNEAIARDRD